MTDPVAERTSTRSGEEATPPAPSPGARPTSARSLKVLVVDDNPVPRHLLESLLRKRDWITHVAEDGLEALQHLKSNRVDLVVADIMMPKLSGMELAQWMRRNPALRDTPILFCSCVSEVETILGTVSLGNVDYVLKPVNPQHFSEKVARLAGSGPRPVSTLPARARREPTKLEPKSLEALPLTVPTLPSTSRKILRLVEGSEANVHDLARVVTSDPGLSTTVLRIVNSSLHSFGKQVASITDACFLMGTRNLESLCLRGALAQDQFNGSETLVSSCWEFSRTTGYLAGRFASVVHPASERDVVLAGLLHAIGIISLLSCPEVELVELIEEADEEICDLAEIERRYLGFDHAEVAQHLARSWHLRPRACEVIGNVERALEYPEQMDLWCLAMAAAAVQSHDSGFTHRANPEGTWHDLSNLHPEFAASLQPHLNEFLTQSTSQRKMLR